MKSKLFFALLFVGLFCLFVTAQEDNKITASLSSTWEPGTPAVLSLTFNQDLHIFSTLIFSFDSEKYEEGTCPFIIENIANGVLSFSSNCYLKEDPSTIVATVHVTGCDDLRNLQPEFEEEETPNGGFAFTVYSGLDYYSSYIPADTEVECRLRVPSMMSTKQITKPIALSPIAASAEGFWEVIGTDAVVAQVPKTPKAMITAKREIVDVEDRVLLNNKTFVDNLVINMQSLSPYMSTPIDLYFSTFDSKTGDMTGALNGSSITSYHQEMNQLFLTLASGSKFIEKTSTGFNFNCGEDVRLHLPIQKLGSVMNAHAFPTRLALITGENPVQNATCKIPIDFQRLLTLQYLDHDIDMNQGLLPLRYGDELNVQVVLRDIGVESDGTTSFGQYTWAGMGHVDARKSTIDNKYIIQSYEVDYHNATTAGAEQDNVGIIVKQNITGFIDVKARYTNSSSVAQLHLLNYKNSTWLVDNIKSLTLDVVNSTTLIVSKDVDNIQPLKLDLIHNNQTNHYYFEIPWSVVNKLNNNALDNYIAFTLNAEFKTNVTKIVPFALHWKLVQSQSPQRYTAYGTMSTLPRYTPDFMVKGLFSNVSNTELTYNFNIIPVFGELNEYFNKNETIIDNFIDHDAIFEHSFVVQMDYNSRELRPLDAPHPKSCNVHTIDKDGQIVEQLKVDFFFSQLYHQFNNNNNNDPTTTINKSIINQHDSALIKVTGTKLTAKYSIEFSCTQKLHQGPKPALFIPSPDDDDEAHDQYITLLPHVYNKYTKLQGTKPGVMPNWFGPSEADIWPAWGVEYSEAGEKYKVGETIDFEHDPDGSGDDGMFNGMGVYIISKHKIHNYTEKMLFLNTAIEQVIEKAINTFNLTELDPEDFHPLADTTSGGIAQNDNFDVSGINFKEWLFPKQNNNNYNNIISVNNDDLQPKLDTLTQYGAIYGYVVRFQELVPGGGGFIPPDDGGDDDDDDDDDYPDDGDDEQKFQILSSIMKKNKDKVKKQLLKQQQQQQQKNKKMMITSFFKTNINTGKLEEIFNDNNNNEYNVKLNSDVIIYLLPDNMKDNTMIKNCPTLQHPLDVKLNDYIPACVIPIGEECYSHAQCAIRANLMMSDKGTPFAAEKPKCINNRCIDPITTYGYGYQDDNIDSSSSTCTKTTTSLSLSSELTIATLTFEQIKKETSYPVIEMSETLQEVVAPYDYPIDDGHDDHHNDGDGKKNKHTGLIILFIVIGLIVVIGTSFFIYKKIQQKKKKDDPMNQGLLMY